VRDLTMPRPRRPDPRPPSQRARSGVLRPAESRSPFQSLCDAAKARKAYKRASSSGRFRGSSRVGTARCGKREQRLLGPPSSLCRSHVLVAGTGVNPPAPVPDHRLFTRVGLRVLFRQTLRTKDVAIGV